MCALVLPTMIIIFFPVIKRNGKHSFLWLVLEIQQSSTNHWRCCFWKGLSLGVYIFYSFQYTVNRNYSLWNPNQAALPSCLAISSDQRGVEVKSEEQNLFSLFLILLFPLNPGTHDYSLFSGSLMWPHRVPYTQQLPHEGCGHEAAF